MKNATIVDSNTNCDNVHILVEGKKILKVSKEMPDIPAIEYDLSGYIVMRSAWSIIKRKPMKQPRWNQG